MAAFQSPTDPNISLDPTAAPIAAALPAGTQSLIDNQNIPAGQAGSPWSLPPTSVVPVNQIAPTTPMNLAPTIASSPNTSNAMVAGATQSINNTQSYIDQATAPKSPEQMQADALTGQVSNLLGQDTGKAQALSDAENANGVPDLNKQLLDLNNQLRTETASYYANQNAVDNQPGVSRATAAVQQAAIDRGHAAKIGLISAQVQAAQGNLQLAQQTAAKAVDLKYATVEDQIKTKQSQLALLQPTLDKQDKIQATALDRQYKDQQTKIADEKQQTKDNLNLALQSGAKTPFINENGKFFDARTGTTYATPAEFFQAAGVSSFAEAYQKGIITDVNGATLADQNFAAQAQAKYPDANIKSTDTPEQVQAKLQNSRIYHKETYIAPTGGSGGSGGSGGTYVPGSNAAVDAYITAVKNGNGTLANVPANIRDYVVQGLASGSSLVDPNTDQQVKAIIAANPGQYGKAADAIDKAYGAGTATKYDSWLKSVYNDKKDVSSLTGGQDTFSPLAGSRFGNESNRIVQNFIKLPGYELTANGLPYIQRIQAAIQTPGSISDQELLDAMTKLSTSGNAVTDAQIKIITGGQNYADKINVLKNKLSSSGGVLSDQQRQDLVKTANDIYDSYKTGYQPIYDQVSSQLEAAGVPQQFWTIPNLNALSSQTSQAPAGATQMTGPDGTTYNVPNDQVDAFVKAGGHK